MEEDNTGSETTSFAMSTIDSLSSNSVLWSGCMTAALLSALFVVQRERSKRRKLNQLSSLEEEVLAAPKSIDRTTYPGGQITIYYGTQTGTAESFAQQLEREGPDHGFYVRVVDLEDVHSIEALEEATAYGIESDNDDDKKARAVFLTATYGEGEPTDNSNEMVRMMKEQIQHDQEEKSENITDTTVLSQLEYCVFGLGNRQYDQFNAIGKFFDASLQSLGATKILPLGLGDDDADLEGDFESWKDQLWVTLSKRYCPEGVVIKPTKKGMNGDGHQLPDCEYAIEYHTDNTSEKQRLPASSVSLENVHGSGRSYFTAIDCPVTKVEELRTPADGGSTKHVEIDVSQAGSNFYETADNMGVLPVNNSSVVEAVATALGYDLNATFSLKAAEGHEWHGDPFPMPLTIRECLTRYLDLTSAPRRSDLKLLTQYATDKLDRQALLRLSSKEGKQEYKEKIMQGYVGIVDLLKLCPSLQIPLEHLISVCHFLLPRYYTISSSSNVHPDSVHMTVAVTQEKRPNGSFFDGLCSTHMASHPTSLRVIVRPSTFRLPKDTSKPILMIGPGTGIAPMRALLQERQHQKATGKNVLYFGCKRPELDYLYQEELKVWQSQGLVDLHVAFSRQDPMKKVYVQHLLKEDAEATWKLISNDSVDGSSGGGAYIYVCGGVKMGHDVTECLKEICVSEGQMSFDDAKDYLGQLAKDGRFVQELWA